MAPVHNIFFLHFYSTFGRRHLLTMIYRLRNGIGAFYILRNRETEEGYTRAPATTRGHGGARLVAGGGVAEADQGRAARGARTGWL